MTIAFDRRRGTARSWAFSRAMRASAIATSVRRSSWLIPSNGLEPGCDIGERSADAWFDEWAAGRIRRA